MIAVFLFALLSSMPAFAQQIISGPWQYQWLSQSETFQQSGLKTIDVPCSPPGRIEDGILFLRTPLPAVLSGESSAIFADLMEQNFEASLDGKVIYRFSAPGSVKNSGLPWHLFSIPKDHKNTFIDFRVEPRRSLHSGFCKPLLIGSEGELYGWMVRNDWPTIAVSILFIFTGIFAIAISFITSTSNPYFSFGSLSTAIGVWIFSTPENHLKLLVLNEPVLWHFLDQISLYLMAPFFIYYLQHLFRDKIFKIQIPIKWLYFIFAFVAALGSVFNLWSLQDSNRVFNSFILISFAITIANVVYLAFRNQYTARLVALGSLIFLFFAVHDWLIGMMILPWHRLMMQWGFLIFLGFLILATLSHVRDMLTLKRKEISGDIRAHAIARTTQSLAHDVRKPFTMLKMIIDVVDGEDDPEEAKKILKESLPEVQQAMASVNGMISDVLEIGSESTQMTESTNPETLIESTLSEIFRIYPDAQVDITYFLNHRHKVLVDTLKMSRVFSNIVGNAVQAMGRRGKLWFKTDEIEEHGKHFIRFCVGNGGSFIPPEHLSKLFEAFFTSGKKGGTGLGLAISQKIVNSHGGRIWCESDDQKGVQFYFTLPVSPEMSDYRPHPLPTSSAQIVAVFERLRRNAQTVSESEINPLEVTIENQIIKLVIAAKAQLKILIVDDEGVYRNSLSSLLNRSEDLKNHISLSFAINSPQALEAAKLGSALVIQDLDLRRNSLNGYEILKALRADGFSGIVCIHSNRSLPEDYKVAVEAGADAVLPKPMSRMHFLKLMLQATERAHAQEASQKEATVARLEIAILDDSKTILRAWKRKIADVAVVHSFESPDAFRAHVASDKSFLSRLSCVITDFYFAEGVLENGLMLADELRPKMRQPIFLCSDGEFSQDVIHGRVDKVIPKEPMSWDELLAHVKAVKCRPHGSQL